MKTNNHQTLATKSPKQSQCYDRLAKAYSGEGAFTAAIKGILVHTVNTIPILLDWTKTSLLCTFTQAHPLGNLQERVRLRPTLSMDASVFFPPVLSFFGFGLPSFALCFFTAWTNKIRAINELIHCLSAFQM